MQVYPNKIVPGRSTYYAPYIPSKYTLRTSLFASIDRLTAGKSIRKFNNEQVQTIARQYAREFVFEIKPASVAISDLKTVLFFNDIRLT